MVTWLVKDVGSSHNFSQWKVLEVKENKFILIVLIS